MKAEIIAIGTELLLGDIINTNAQFISKELATIGINIYHQSVVGDNEERILKSFEEAFYRSDIIITTGGLGPTKDDMTKELAAKYFKKDLVLHKPSWEAIEQYFIKSGRKVEGNNKKQAYFPEDAIIMDNPFGTAPGAIIQDEKSNKTFIILPGPPREMKPMFINQALPYLKKYSDSVLVSKVLRIFGIGEAYMDELVGDLIEKQTNPTIAPYAKDLDVTLRITAKGNNEDEANKLINSLEEKVKQRLGDNIYGEGEDSLEDIVGKLLVDKNLSIATAESCTGGMLAAALVNYSGISSVFKEGAVTYSNEAKISRLGVKKETLDEFGAVSEETAKEMAEGIAKTAQTNIGISTTGIAGPGGGTDEKPVGLVYVGLHIDGKTTVRKFNFQGNRQRVRQKTMMNALDLLRRTIENM